MTERVDERLLAVLTSSAGRGFIGGDDLDAHVRHALGFAAVAPTRPDRAVDLGSGGGLPGLVLAFAWPSSSWILLDGSETRAEFLREAVAELDLGGRVAVVGDRAELVGHDESHRAAADLVVARSFGPPAVVAECAAPLLRVGGHLVVSEPPRTAGAPDRWHHPAELAELGLARVHAAPAGSPIDEPTDPGTGAAFQVLVQEAPCPERYPRRVGVPAKRPLFG